MKPYHSNYFEEYCRYCDRIKDSCKCAPKPYYTSHQHWRNTMTMHTLISQGNTRPYKVQRIPKDGNHMTINEFRTHELIGTFDINLGYGYLADSLNMTYIPMHLTGINAMKQVFLIYPELTHIVWFNNRY
jgi:hypothetical protein